MSDETPNPVEELDPTPKQSGRMPGDVVNKNTAHLADEERSAIRWLHNHATLNNLSLGETGALIRYDGSTISKLYNGKYEGKLDAVVKAIESFRKVHEERANLKKLPFVMTKQAQRIFNLCHMARRLQRIGFIYGDSQIGKTITLKKYVEQNNHGSTIYVSMPTGGAKSLFLSALAKKLNITGQQQQRELIRRIIEAFDDRMLLVVDELHQAVRFERSIYTIEFIREIHDATGCGVVLSGTNVFQEAVKEGPWSKVLVQISRRSCAVLPLKPVTGLDDLGLFAKEYKLPPASGEAFTLQAEINKQQGLGMWLALLRLANEAALKRGKPMSWELVIKTHAGLLKLESGEE